MPVDLSEILVVGVSTRALFNLEEENKIFEEQGIEAFRNYQLENENELLDKIQNIVSMSKNQLLEIGMKGHQKITANFI